MPEADLTSLHQPACALPARCDVLVVGAGPAGSAAANGLARAGVDVVLVDQHVFPRDKICGDGLIPDAHHAMRRLGVLDAVMARAQRATHIACIAPRGGRVDVPGTVAVLPRRVLDHLLCRGAITAGARFFAPLRFGGVIEAAGRVVGATLRDGDASREIHCRWVVLATGAVPQALMACDMAIRQTPSGVAMRGYVKNDAMSSRIDKLEVVWHRALAPGYGWIFPCGDGVFNFGAGIAQSHDDKRRGETNLRAVFDAFSRVYEPARALLDGGEWLAPPKGAPLRCTLRGARRSKPGLLVTGEAAGSTYSFTGEGIGKAMETGLLASQAVTSSADDAAVRQVYETSLVVLQPRFDLYERANAVNRHPWIIDLLLWRARKSERLVQRMSGVLEETGNPGNLLSWRGVRRLFTE